MNNPQRIPSGWAVSKLSELVSQLISGSGFPKKYQGKTSGKYPFAKVSDISTCFRNGGKYIGQAKHYIDDNTLKKIKAKIFPENSIVFPKIGEALKGNYRVISRCQMLFDNNVMGVVPTNGVYIDFLYYFLTTQDFGRFSVATAVPSIRRGDIEAIPILLPPTNEQHRIVAKIEELFTELDRGIESLKKAREQLKIYRQALLKQAFEGKLTEQWRRENADKLETADQLLERIKKERDARYQQQLDEWKAAVKQWEEGDKEGRKPAKPKRENSLAPVSERELSELPDLPQHWCWVRPQDVQSYKPYSIGIGPFGSNLKVIDYKDSGIPLIFVRNITNNNFKDELKYISKSKYLTLLPHSVEPLDIIVTKMGDPPGDAEIYPMDCPTAILTADCLKFRIWNEFASRKYFKHCINSVIIKKQLGFITKGVAQKKISASRFKTLLFPFPPKAEQDEIATIIDTGLREVCKFELDLDESIEKSESLRQSILKKAFSGRLVPQDPNDEPAAALLERITKEKAEAVAKISKIKPPKKRQGTIK